MDVLSDLENKTDPGEDTVQSTLFSEEVARGEKDIAPQVIDAPPEQHNDSSCTYCGRRVDTDDDATHKEVRTWISGPKKDSAVLREYTGRYACGNCISNLRAGIAPDQPELESLLDATPETSDVGEILTDRSIWYQRGYEDGLGGIAPSVPAVAQKASDYKEGYDVGKELRAAQEWSGGTRSSVGRNEGPFVYLDTDDDLPL